jgi:hypothetical protein
VLKLCGTHLLSAMLSLAANSHLVCALGPGASQYQPSMDQRPSSDAMQLAGRVNAAVTAICASHCPEVKVLRNPTAAGVMLVAEEGQPKLVYSPRFFASVHEGYSDAGIIAIIAHEFGHALDDALGAAWIQRTWTPELNADSWAGCALAKANLSAVDLQNALHALEKYPAPAHAAWTIRIVAIRAGYSGCGGDRSKLNSAAEGRRK